MLRQKLIINIWLLHLVGFLSLHTFMRKFDLNYSTVCVRINMYLFLSLLLTYLLTYLLIYLLTYLLTTWSRVLFEKLTGSKLVKKFPAFYGTRKFITAFTSARHLSLSWASSIHSIPPHPTSWKSILILASLLLLGLPSGVFPSNFPTFQIMWDFFYCSQGRSTVYNKDFLSEVIKLTFIVNRPLNLCTYYYYHHYHYSRRVRWAGHVARMGE